MYESHCSAWFSVDYELPEHKHSEGSIVFSYFQQQGLSHIRSLLNIVRMNEYSKHLGNLCPLQFSTEKEARVAGVWIIYPGASFRVVSKHSTLISTPSLYTPMVVGEQCVGGPAVCPGLVVGSSTILFCTDQGTYMVLTACSF